MAVKFTPSPQPASRDVPASKAPNQEVHDRFFAGPKFDKTAYMRDYMRKKRSRTVSVDMDLGLVKRWKATGPDWLVRMQEALEKAL